MKRIALLNFGGIGDEILFSPILEALHSAEPEAELTLFLEHRSRAAAALFPQLSQVITVPNVHNRLRLFLWLLNELRRGHYAAVISSGSSPFIAVMLGLTGIPVRVGYVTGKWTDWFLTYPAVLNKTIYAGEMYYELAKAYLTKRNGTGAIRYTTTKDRHTDAPRRTNIPKLGLPEDNVLPPALLTSPPLTNAQKRLLIHPGVSQMSIDKHIFKGWSARRWVELINRLLVDGHQVLLAGGPDDNHILEAITTKVPPHLQLINMFGQTRNLLELAALIAQVDLLVSVDSAPMHLAVGLDKPVVVMFGPTDPDKLLPKLPGCVAVYREDLTCRPCLWATRQISCDNPVCLDVSVDAMFDAIANVLKTAHTK